VEIYLKKIKSDMFVDKAINCNLSGKVVKKFLTLNTIVALFELRSFRMLTTYKAKSS